MNTLTKLALVALAVAGLQACNPYTSENSGPPSVISVLGVSGDPDAQIGTGAIEATAPAAAGGAWTLAGMPVSASVIFVKTDKLLNGDTIQTSPTDCTPVGNWLQVNGAAATGWMTCYNPASPSPNEGSSVVIYQGANPTGGPQGTGWFGQTANVTGVYVITGSIADKQGHALAIDVDALIADAPGAANVTDATANITWFAASAVNVATQTLQRQDPGATTWTNLATAGPNPFADSGLTAGSNYLYRVEYVSSIAPALTIAGQTTAVCTLPVAPAAPTVAKTSGTAATITWTAATGAATYEVQRAPESTTTPGTPGTYVTIASGITATTYDDTAIPAGNYFYRIAAVAGCASTANGAASVMTTFP